MSFYGDQRRAHEKSLISAEIERAGAGFSMDTDIGSKYTSKNTEHNFTGLEALSEEPQSTDNVNGTYYLRMLRAIRGRMLSCEYDSPSTNCLSFWSVLP